MRKFLIVGTTVFSLFCGVCFSVSCSAKNTDLNKFKNISETIVDNYDGSTDPKNSFFALISRMRYVKRWSVFKNSEEEDLENHSFEVAVIAHALATIKNEKFGGKVDENKACVKGLFHDFLEVITGDAPTPVKYFDLEMKKMYTKLEEKAAKEAIERIEDEDIRAKYSEIVSPNNASEDISDEDKEIARIVKAADNISALIKCLREKRAGNNDFDKVYERLSDKIKNDKNEEVKYFVDNYLKIDFE